MSYWILIIWTIYYKTLFLRSDRSFLLAHSVFQHLLQKDVVVVVASFQLLTILLTNRQNDSINYKITFGDQFEYIFVRSSCNITTRMLRALKMKDMQIIFFIQIGTNVSKKYK